VPTAQRILPESAPDVRWGWWDVLYGFAAFFLALTLAIVTFSVLRPDETWVDAFDFGTSIVTYALLIGVIVAASRRKGLRSLAADFGLRFRWIDLALGLGAGLAVKVFSIVVAAIALLLTGYLPEQGNFVLSPEPLWMVLNGVLIATLLAPFAEELFFRGLVLRASQYRALRRGSSPVRATVIAIIVSSVLFSALHLYQSTDVVLLVILGLSTLALGVVNSVLAITTKRLGAAIISHVFFNGSGIAVAALTGS
jgi:membrane protease YdiL (CAAX protease family)